MVLEQYRDRGRGFLEPIARAAQRLGLTPNALSALSFLFAAGAAWTFYISGPARPWMLVLASVLVMVNAFLDGADGLLARMTDTASARGDYLDHVLDRYADILILTGLTFGAWTTPIVGFFAVVGTLLTSYMGTQAQAVGVGRNYRGFLGRADRLGLLTAIPILEAIVLWQGWVVPYGTNLITLMLAYIAIVGNLTALQRFIQGWRALREAPPGDEGS